MRVCVYQSQHFPESLPLRDHRVCLDRFLEVFTQVCLSVFVRKDSFEKKSICGPILEVSVDQKRNLLVYSFEFPQVDLLVVVFQSPPLQRIFHIVVA